MGIGDCGLVIVYCGLGPMPNPQYPIPNPQYQIPIQNNKNLNISLKNLLFMNIKY